MAEPQTTGGSPATDEQRAADEFWRRLAAGALHLQHCRRCGRPRWPTAPYCPHCGGDLADWRPLPARGTVWSSTTYHHAFDRRFADDLPYTVALIELAGGVRMIGRLLDDAAIGETVELVYDSGVDERRLDWRRAER